MRRFTRSLTTIAAALIAATTVTTAGAVAPAAASNRAFVDIGVLTELNDSGVRGIAVLVEHNGHLRVNLAALGLERGQVHLNHIHGFGDQTQATCPDMSLAGDDGILSFAEGLPAYGPVVVTTGQDLTPRSHLAFSRTFRDTDAGASVGTMGALDQYVIVVHGQTNPGGFDVTQPVACAVLKSIGR